MSYQNYRNVDSYFSKDGKHYFYNPKSFNSIDNEKICIDVANSKVSEDILTALLELDKEEQLNERYAHESKDSSLFRSGLLLENIENIQTKSIFGSCISEEYHGPFEERLAGIYDFVDKDLSPELQTIFYRHLLLNESLTDIRKDELAFTGKCVSHQAWSKRKKSLIKKLKKYLLGSD